MALISDRNIMLLVIAGALVIAGFFISGKKLF
jgi:hypothetical protein